MRAQTLGHVTGRGYMIGIFYDDDEIPALIENGIDDFREKFVPHREQADKFCRRWNRQHAGQSAIDIINRRSAERQLDMFAG